LQNRYLLDSAKSDPAPLRALCELCVNKLFPYSCSLFLLYTHPQSLFLSPCSSFFLSPQSSYPDGLLTCQRQASDTSPPVLVACHRAHAGPAKDRRNSLPHLQARTTDNLIGDRFPAGLTESFNRFQHTVTAARPQIICNQAALAFQFPESFEVARSNPLHDIIPNPCPVRRRVIISEYRNLLEFSHPD